MDYLQFLQSAEQMTGLDREAARQAAEETLTTLAERLGRPAAAELASAAGMLARRTGVRPARWRRVRYSGSVVWVRTSCPGRGVAGMVPSRPAW